MHGELIYQHPERREELRVPGNAILEDDRTVQWEFHDKELTERRRQELFSSLAELQDRGGRVQLSFIPASPPLEEVESGPHVNADHSRPIEYEIVELSRDGTTVKLRQAEPGTEV